MKPTMLSATMMVVTVVDLVLILNIAQNVNVLEEVLAMELLILWLEMDTAKMKPTMLSVTMMAKTVVDLLSIETNALSVFVTVCIFLIDIYLTFTIFCIPIMYRVRHKFWQIIKNQFSRSV